jgi:hypothetical protein
MVLFQVADSVQYAIGMHPLVIVALTSSILLESPTEHHPQGKPIGVTVKLPWLCLRGTLLALGLITKYLA